ncbi:hypothetical protein TNCV_1172081 [Trichonephila clavipes]|uniref:Uncharacterized protein n=1 Tax=Trichonephila clavipes TaxID=2585209 RepID=A0A8X6VCV4_TRICX|nr:hypothetical protein TNCV_1172081 [Trichonephila clavipes]
MESVLNLVEIDNVTEKVVYLARQINLKVDSNDIQALPDFHNQELTMDEPTEIHEQDIEEFESLFQSDDRMTVGDLTDGLS